MIRALSVVILLFFSLLQPAYAYIGPGGGLTAIGAIIAVIAVVIVLFFGFLWYPIKRLRKKWRARQTETDTPDESG